MKSLKRSGAAALVAINLLIPLSARAQDSSKSDIERQTDAIKAQTELIKAEIELKKQENIARNQALDVPAPAKEPTLTSGIDKGTIDIKIPAIIQGHRAAIALARRIAEKRVVPNIVAAHPLLIVAGVDPFNSIGPAALLVSMTDQIQKLNLKVAAFVDGTEFAFSLANIASAANGLRNTVASFGSLFELFKVKTTFSDVTVEVADEVYASAIAEAVLGQASHPQVTVLTSTLLPPPDSAAFDSLTAFQAEIDKATLNSVKLAAELAKIDHDLADQKSIVEEGKDKKDSKTKKAVTAARNEINRLTERKTAGTALQKALDDSLTIAKEFNKNFFSPGADGKIPAGYAMLRQARVVSRNEQDGGNILVLSRGPSGGINRTIESLFNSGSLSHAGGAIVTYYLYDGQKNLVSTGSFMGITPFRRLGDGGGDIGEISDEELIIKDE